MSSNQDKKGEVEHPTSQEAPIVRLSGSHNGPFPPELLGEIFKHFDYEKNGGKFAVFALNKPPLSLLQICSTWRSVALHMLNIWNSMLLILDSATPQPHREKMLVPVIHDWLSRSGSQRLYLSITLGYAQEHNDIAMAVSQYSSRISHLQFRGINQWFRPDSTVFQEALPNLEILEVERWADDPAVGQIIAFGQAPNIKELVWEGDDYAIAGPNYGNLVKLTIDVELPFSECAHLLQSCLSLEHLVISIHHPHNYENPIPPLMIHLPYLYSLTIVGDSSDLFRHLISPQLVVLKCFSGAAWPHAQLMEMYDRPEPPTIRYIHLSDTSIREQQLSEWLVRGGSIFHLTIDGEKADISNGFLRLLTLDNPSSTASIVCPKLTTLHLFGCLMCTEKTLMDMLHSRLEEHTDDGKTQVVRLASFQVNDKVEGLGQLIKLAKTTRLHLRFRSVKTGNLLSEEALAVCRVCSSYFSMFYLVYHVPLLMTFSRPR